MPVGKSLLRLLLSQIAKKDNSLVVSSFFSECLLVRRVQEPDEKKRERLGMDLRMSKDS